MRIRLRANVLYATCQAFGGISRDELARRLKVSSTTAYRIERGDVSPSPRFIASLMHVTGRSFEELFEIEVGAGVMVGVPQGRC
jgi:transcriptional regulator with XRE-family HTH domain